MQDAGCLLLPNANAAVFENLHTCVLHGLHAHKVLSKNQGHLAQKPVVERVLDAAILPFPVGYLHPLYSVTWPFLSFSEL